MISRYIQTETEKEMANRLIANRKLPFTVTIKDGKDRTVLQNSFQWAWMKEIAEQLNFDTSNHAQAFCKLHYGVPIKREDEDFRIKYDKHIKPRTYEEKLELMMEPIAFPVTSLMNTKQMNRYFETVAAEMNEQGVYLKFPEDR